MGTEAKAENTGRPRRDVDVGAERRKRLTTAALNDALAKKRCRHCGTLGVWEVYNRERGKGRVRYIRCKGCGRCDQVPVIVPEEVSDG